MIISTCCSGDKNLEIQFRACNFRFVFLHTVLRCSVKSSLLSIMTPKSFWEALFLIVIFLHLKMGKVLGVPRVIKSHLSKFSTRKLLKNHSPKIKKSFWSFQVTSSNVLPNVNKVLSSASSQTFELSANKKMSLIKILKRRGPRKEPWGTSVVILRQLLQWFSILYFLNLFLN